MGMAQRKGRSKPKKCHFPSFLLPIRAAQQAQPKSCTPQGQSTNFCESLGTHKLLAPTPGSLFSRDSDVFVTSTKEPAQLIISNRVPGRIAQLSVSHLNCKLKSQKGLKPGQSIPKGLCSLQGLAHNAHWPAASP